MALPFFYASGIGPGDTRFTLDEENSRHAVQVLRMRAGQALHLTNGAGGLFEAEIVNDHKKHCEVSTTRFTQLPSPEKKITIAISLIKNTARFEWFLEKATEIGVHQIVPLQCLRTEKLHFRHPRMNGILISALLQSRQTWLPQLQEPVPMETYINQARADLKLIAHCGDDAKQALSSYAKQDYSSAIMLVGPEGDFTTDEIEQALARQYLPVSLGETRLRTETAGMVAAALLRLG